MFALLTLDEGTPSAQPTSPDGRQMLSAYVPTSNLVGEQVGEMTKESMSRFCNKSRNVFEVLTCNNVADLV